MGGWGAKPGVLCRRWKDSGAGPQVGTECIDSDSGDVLQGGTQHQPIEDQFYGLYARLHLGDVD